MASAPEVTVYTSPRCIPCEELKRHLTSHDIAFNLVDVMLDEDAQDMLEGAGFHDTPVIAIDGDLLDGADVEQVNARLGL